jgi:hypothetical protein
MISYKACKIKTLSEFPEYKAQLNSLIENELGYIFPYHYEVDFYPLMNEKNHHQLYMLFHQEKLIGHIGVIKKTIINQSKSIPALFIGGIVIEKSFQGLGLFKDFFSDVLSKYDDISVKLLWSDKHELYNKFGFYLKGIQYEYQQNTNQQIYKLKKMSELDANDKKFLKQSYDTYIQNKIALSRTDADWENIFMIESCEVIFINDVGYAIRNKGMDLNNIIHEVCHPELEKNIPSILSYGTLWTTEFIRHFNPVKQGVALIKLDNEDNQFILNSPVFIGGVDSI